VDVSQAEKESDSIEKLLDASQYNQLEQLVGLKGAEATLLFVQEELPSYEAILKTQADFPEDLNRAVESAARVKLDLIAEKFRAAGAQVKVEIVHGPPAYMIEQVGRDQGANLTVVTAGNRAGEKFLIGGTSQHIIRHSPCSVLVLRHGMPPLEKVQRILVAVDGSERCLQSVTSAVEHLNLNKADVSINICHIVTLNPLVASFTPQSFVTILEENLLMEGEVALANAKKAFSGKGFKSVEIELGHGNAAGEIMKMQEKSKANLIVIGSQGKGAVKHFLMGHVANRVAMHATTPTVVAR
jgi:nucleotide-binding universal stress UspA family protein